VAKAVRSTPVKLAGHPGLLLRPERARWLYVLCHGAGAGMRHEFMAAMATALAARSIATLRWELPYMAAGRARPDPQAVCEAAVRDVVGTAAARWPELRRIAGGKSFGGRMTSNAAAEEPLPIEGVAFLGFPLHPPKQPATIRAEHLARVPVPMLFVQGTEDDLAELALLRPVVAALGARAQLIEIAGADHRFDVPKRSGRTGADVRAAIAGAIAEWVGTLQAPPQP
jgi:predicted alpha/beta-hydrolase family hydrolase